MTDKPQLEIGRTGVLNESALTKNRLTTEVRGGGAISDKQELSRAVIMAIGTQIHGLARDWGVKVLRGGNIGLDSGLAAGLWGETESLEQLNQSMAATELAAPPKKILIQAATNFLNKIKLIIPQYFSVADGEKTTQTELIDFQIERWDELLPLYQLGWLGLMEHFAGDKTSVFNRSLFIPETGVRPQTVRLKELAGWLNQAPEGEKFYRAELAKRAILKGEEVIDEIAGRPLLTKFAQKEPLVARQGIKEYFWQLTGDDWLVKLKRDKEFTPKEIEQLRLLRMIIRAQAEVKFLFNSVAAIDKSTTMEEVLKEFEFADHLAKPGGESNYLSAEEKEALKRRAEMREKIKTIKSPLGAIPDGFLIDPGDSPSRPALKYLQEIREMVKDHYARHKQQSLWQNREFLNKVREGVRRHGFTIQMTELKLVDGPVPGENDEKHRHYTAEFYSYAIALATAIKGSGKLTGKTEKEIDPLIKAFRGARVIYLGHTENLRPQVGVVRCFGNPLEEAETRQAIKKRYRLMSGAVYLQWLIAKYILPARNKV